MRSFLILFLLVCPSLASILHSEPEGPVEGVEPDSQAWVDSVYATLTPEQRIGQLLMVAAYSSKGNAHRKELEILVRDRHVGGLIFFKGHPVKQAHWTNHFQAMAKVPLMIAMDAEWGLSMRLDSTTVFPKQLTLGAIENNDLIYEMGYEIGRQCKRLGVHVNLAPVIDVNTNPLNPVINFRSFGENRFNVALKGLAYMNGLQQAGVMACAKHFPGHGDTDQDSHKTLPTIPHSAARLRSVEMFPFGVLFDNGLQSVMVAHLNIPAFESKSGRAASLSKKITQDLLQEEMGFKGLVFSDALNMKGVSEFPPGQVDLEALKAGNDILLFSEDVPKAIKMIEAAVENGEIAVDWLEAKVRKVLHAKFALGLGDYEPVVTEGLYGDLNRPEAEVLRRKLYEASLTIASNTGRILPYARVDTSRFASLSFGVKKPTPFEKNLALYAPFEHYRMAQDAPVAEQQKMLGALKDYNRVVIALHGMSWKASNNYGLTPTQIQFIDLLSEQTEVTLVVFGSPYSIKLFGSVQALVVAYEERDVTQAYAAQLLFGGIRARGKLPVTASDKYIYGSGYLTEAAIRLKHTIPEELGIASKDLLGIDSIAEEAIAMEATPGCQILFARKGKVFYNRSFGHHTYAGVQPVRSDDLYDLASITKIAATTLSLMALDERGLVDVNGPVRDFFSKSDPGNLAPLRVRDILRHQSGLTSWIPFYKRTIVDTVFEEYYCTKAESEGYEICVSKDLFLRNDYPDSIWNRIANSFIHPSPKYVYSDLGFYVFKEMIDELSGVGLDAYADHMFYRSLGLSTLTYNPLQKFPSERIVPTEMDLEFRGELVHGFVHDPGAAMLGGVGGHAGLFSNAGDLAILMQMLLNRGVYGGKRYFTSQTIERYTTRQSLSSRRGLGFDKPEPDPDKNGPTCDEASLSTYGHTGFTGTAIWADPEYDLVFVFLSNRVYPDAQNWKLVREDVRTRIQSVAYQAIFKGEQAEREFRN